MPPSKNEEDRILSSKENNLQSSRVKELTRKSVVKSSISFRIAKKPVETQTILYPWLYQMSSTLDDPTWSKIAEDASKGNLPKGFTFETSKILSYRKGNNKIVRVHLSPEPEKAIYELVNFVRENTTFSEKDKEILQLEKENKKFCAKRYSTWKGITSKTDKSNLKNWFISDMTQKYNLSLSEITDLKSVLAYGFILQQFNNSNIIFVDGYISEITDLKFDLEKRKWISLNDRSFVKKVSDKTVVNFVEGEFSALSTYGKKIKVFLAESGSDYEKTFKEPVSTRTVTTIS